MKFSYAKNAVSISGLLSKSTELYGKVFLSLFLVTIIATIPFSFIGAVAKMGHISGTQVFLSLLMYLLLLYYLIVMFYVAYEKSVTDCASFKKALVNALRRYFPVLWTGFLLVLLAYLFIFIASGVFVGVSFTAHLLGLTTAFNVQAMMPFIFILIAIVALFFLTWFLPILPLILFDRAKKVIRGAVNLTAGCYWRSFFVLIVAALPSLLIALLNFGLIDILISSVFLRIAEQFICNLLILPWVIVLVLNHFHDLKIRKSTRGVN